MRVLDEAVAVVEAEPQSAAALTLFALMSTMAFEGPGCLFKLVKLRDLNAAQRQLAYGLMELMAEGRSDDDDWQAARARIEALIKAA